MKKNLQSAGLNRFIDILIEQKIINKNEGDFLISRYGTVAEVCEILLNRNIATQIQLSKASAVLLDIPFVKLAGTNIDISVFSVIPLEACEKYGIIAFDAQDDTVKIAVARPYQLNGNDITSQGFFKSIENKKIKFELNATTLEDFTWALESYRTKSAVGEKIQVDPGLPKLAVEPTTVEPQLVQPPVTTIPLVKPTISQPNTFQAQAVINKTDVVSAQEYQIINGVKTASTGALVLEQNDISTVQSASQMSGAIVNSDDLEEKNLDKFLGQGIQSVTELANNIKTGLIPKIVASIISLSIFEKASDIHIEPQKHYLRLRYRVDGDLKEYIRLPLSLHPPIISRIKILSNLKIDEQRIPQDGRYDAIANAHEIDIRVSSLPTVHGEKIVMRVLDKTASNYKLEELGFNKLDLQKLISEINKPWGMILATGPTGSGKSTTLYAIINKIISPQINIITLEDPVEYDMAGVNQVQVKPKIGFSFAEGLRSILRQDPNVIMVGEIRDSETAELATHAALTGHLVLSTLHTNNASGALPRLINMGVEPFLITSAINAIIAQRLVRKLCPICKEKTSLPSEEIEKMKQILDNKINVNWQVVEFYTNGKGCDKCHNGFSGRLGVYEILIMSDEIEQAAIANKSANDIKDIACRQGMVTLEQDGIIKVIKGLTTYPEILKVTDES
ncbi:MAG: type IV pilus assembly protein PilB [Candidatus Berkelbacteria bacterium Licking1014_85]|uniref:Type IV pilus assembly protein PilB n=1 Tax=Candidatus Berkelbacteria bacterium Licking1014_85 TaxID=2017148 RepID=A0A554LM68_9BACT|nr:MAG: type IV pilus assembly protein PilB [Candidatus Berkelbacteria bacterium Licking1014_85]